MSEIKNNVTQKIWFLSDTHFGHGNILKYCHRPFSTIEDHDQTIIDNINKLVAPGDILYHLGDFAFKHAWSKIKCNRSEIVKHYRDKIKCNNIILIMGNHDPHFSNGQPKIEILDNFREIHTLLNIKLTRNERTYRLVLCHYALRTWNQAARGAIMLYGHSHGSLPESLNSLSTDVGIDAIAARSVNKTMIDIRSENSFNLLDSKNYRPIEFDEILTLMFSRQFVPIDHHK